MKRALLLLTLSFTLISCGVITPTPDPQNTSLEAPEEFLGEFYCSGHEAGMLAFAGMLIIQEGGSVELEWMYAADPLVGTWQYDSAQGEMTFSTDLEISHALYDDIVDQLEVHLREGVERAHVETGVMYCQRQ
jgi:hypothetical protein